MVDLEAGDSVDVAGDLSDPEVLGQLPLGDARTAVVAMPSDAATVLAATILRGSAPDLPILAAAHRTENLARIQLSGVDFALSIGQVAGQLLARHVLDETVSLQPRIRLVRVEPGALEGRQPLRERIREHTGCTVVAAEREGALIMDLRPSFSLAQGDALYVCGTTEAIDRFTREFTTQRT